jgi:hypothetical protein
VSWPIQGLKLIRGVSHGRCRLSTGQVHSEGKAPACHSGSGASGSGAAAAPPAGVVAVAPAVGGAAGPHADARNLHSQTILADVLGARCPVIWRPVRDRDHLRILTVFVWNVASEKQSWDHSTLTHRGHTQTHFLPPGETCRCGWGGRDGPPPTEGNRLLRTISTPPWGTDTGLGRIPRQARTIQFKPLVFSGIVADRFGPFPDLLGCPFGAFWGPARISRRSAANQNHTSKIVVF